MAAAFENTAFENTAFEVAAAAAAVKVSPVIDRGGELANAALDLVIDPLTRDLIDADDGGFVESADSRTAVLFQLQSIYLAWWGDPFSGSRIREILSGEAPGGAQEVRDEALRALQVLVDEGIISDLGVDTDTDENGRAVIVLGYTDRASGRRVDLAYVPFGG